MMVIGDVHGKVNKYKEIIDQTEQSIQLGDFGFHGSHDWHKLNVDGSKHKILFGNHDCYPYINEEYSLGDHSCLYLENTKIFTVRGALSIDKYRRTHGVDWFSNEELSYAEANRAIEDFVKFKPNIVLSHDCPSSVAQRLFGYTDHSTTSRNLQYMLDEFPPDLWIFGHYHRSIVETKFKTKFICLSELETIDIS